MHMKSVDTTTITTANQHLELIPEESQQWISGGSQPDSEWKYVPIRRYPSAASLIRPIPTLARKTLP